MTRPLRLEFPNAVYQITSRGNEGGAIFLDQEDFEQFLYYLELVQERYRAIVYAFVLMNDHYHLLLEIIDPNLSRLMRDLNGHYTVYFNNRYKRNGHLFRGRYRSILIDKENYLLELSRYIHLNPVRVGMVRYPEEYKYSSVNYYYVPGAAPAWLKVDYILNQFGDTPEKQSDGYKEFVRDGIDRDDDFSEKLHAGAILGSKSFIDKIHYTFLSGMQFSKQIPDAKKLRYGIDLNEIAEAVTGYYNADRSILNKRKIKFNQAKKSFIYFSRRYTDCTLEELSNFLNNSISSVAISKLFSRTQEELNSQKSFRQDIEALEKGFLERNNKYQVNT